MPLLAAVFFALRGIWPVLVFGVIKISACAFGLFGRHAGREPIALTGTDLLVELMQVEEVRQFWLDSYFTRVDRLCCRTV